MFAIKAGNKFIKPEIGHRNTIYSITLSEKPMFFKTKDEAQQIFDICDIYLISQIERLEKRRDDDITNRDIAQRDIARWTAQIAEMEELPYKEVVKKIQSAQQKINKAKQTIDFAEPARYQREINRLQRVIDTKPGVVQIQQTAIKMELA